VKSGLIIDGSFVEVPKQRNTKEENEQIKKGEIPKTLSANPHVLAQKDTDARWTKNNDISYFGYKDHDLVDEEYKLIRDYARRGQENGFGEGKNGGFWKENRRKGKYCTKIGLTERIEPVQ